VGPFLGGPILAVGQVHIQQSPAVPNLPPQPATLPKRPPSAVPKAALALFAFLIVTLLLGLVVGLLLPTLRAGSTAQAKAASAQRMATIYSALKAYADDNQGALPESHALLSARLTPRYITNLPTAPDGSEIYYYVPLVNLRTVSDPSAQIILFERPGLWPRAGGTLLTADGTTTYIDGLRYDQRVTPLVPQSLTPSAPALSPP
jgi:type II secretory pathway pseudopilin PulG